MTGTVPTPEYTETADYFAKALELCAVHAGQEAPVYITIQGAIPIMLRIGRRSPYRFACTRR